MTGSTPGAFPVTHGASQTTYGGDPGDAFVTKLVSAGAPPAQHTLTVSKAGSGSGSVTSTPAGIGCGASCSHPFNDGTKVTLKATPASGSTFTGFTGGGCSGTATSCAITVTAATTITATFNTIPPSQLTLTVTKAGSGSGSVTSTPAGIGCGASCSHPFNDGTKVTLTATPASGSTFAGFSGGGCTGTSACTITLTTNTTVTATFATSHPTTITTAATNTTAHAATLNGTVNPNGAATMCHFVYGRSTRYGRSVTTSSPGGRTSAVRVSARISGLFARTRYHYKLVCSSAAGRGAGIDRSFKTHGRKHRKHHHQHPRHHRR